MTAAKRIKIEMVEADVESAFSLIDAAHEAHRRGDEESATQVLVSAERVFDDIEERLSHFEKNEREPFRELVAEVRRELDEAERE